MDVQNLKPLFGFMSEILVFPRVKAFVYHTSTPAAWPSLFFNCNQFCECKPVSQEEKAYKMCMCVRLHPQMSTKKCSHVH